MKASCVRCLAARVVKYWRRNWMRQCSCKMVPCSRSTKPFVQAWRGARPRVSNAQCLARHVERGLELRAPIGEHALHPPARPAIERHEDLAQEGGGRLGRERGQQPGDAIGARRVARRDLPDLAHAFELADIKGVDRDELTRLLGMDMPSPGARGARGGASAP
jgi:hypothetical protein